MKKFKRLLLLVVLVLLSVCISPASQVSATEIANSPEYFIQATFNGDTITVSSSKDVYFTLLVEVKGNTTKSSWKSNLLYISSSETKTYTLETLFPDFNSLDVILASVEIDNITYSYMRIFRIIASIVLIIFLILFIKEVKKPMSLDEILMSEL